MIIRGVVLYCTLIDAIVDGPARKLKLFVQEQIILFACALAILHTSKMICDTVFGLKIKIERFIR